MTNQKQKSTTANTGGTRTNWFWGPSSASRRNDKRAAFSRAFATMALLAMLGAALGPADAAQIQLNPNAPYLCAAVQGDNTSNGAPVITYSCSGGPQDK